MGGNALNKDNMGIYLNSGFRQCQCYTEGISVNIEYENTDFCPKNDVLTEKFTDVQRYIFALRYARQRLMLSIEGAPFSS